MLKECDHTSVGVLVWNDGKLLLIERRKFPFGFAPPAGHVDDRATFDDAARSELREETGLIAIKLHPLIEGLKRNLCRRKNGSWHYWKLYQAKVEGVIVPNLKETKSVGWYDESRLQSLVEHTRRYVRGQLAAQERQETTGLEQVWCEWFATLHLLKG